MGAQIIQFPVIDINHVPDYLSGERSRYNMNVGVVLLANDHTRIRPFRKSSVLCACEHASETRGETNGNMRHEIQCETRVSRSRLRQGVRCLSQPHPIAFSLPLSLSLSLARMDHEKF